MEVAQGLRCTSKALPGALGSSVTQLWLYFDAKPVLRLFSAVTELQEEGRNEQ